jgi:MSHA biogenesis protein MshI
MWWPQKQTSEPTRSIACCLSDTGYSMAVITDNKQVQCDYSRVFNESTISQLPQALAKDVDRFNIIGEKCQLILLPGQYQLLLMDAADVPEAEMAKALRWSLKGLSDYDLDDAAIDAFMVPSPEGDSQKKAMIAITPLSLLNQKRALLESAFLDANVASIAEMALGNLFSLMFPEQLEKDSEPMLVVSLYESVRKVHLLHNHTFYLIRELTPGESPVENEPVEMINIIFELERSIDYCLNKLNLPEPKQVFFTPAFHQAVSFFKTIEEKLKLSANIIDLNDYLDIEGKPDLQKQQGMFYSITGAIRGLPNETAN